MNKILFCLFCFVACFGKNTNIKDRIKDTTDMVSFSLDTSFGFEIGISKYNLGLFAGREIIGFKASEGKIFELRDLSRTLVIGKFAALKSESLDHFFRKKKYLIGGDNTQDIIPTYYYGRLKLRVGFIWGFSAEINF